ncbi:hypothetical protein LFAB_16875 [Lactiplantibacillus fabifermentans T30PCM01]|uniref:ABC transporter domain-containing protein n=1 Tax=Lactiplantibacillus fabifermentans T30PCM01 TaxID=1400520 RepID=W6T4H8_9LACO|nr:hypothetical protein LFAB_16875 [Lactiplantibacillus fabifermentans T30PCM01]
MNSILKVQHIQMGYNANKSVLKDISFSVRQGIIFGIVGPSGSGKSTLLNIINGQLASTNGQVLFQDQPVRLLDKAFHQQVTLFSAESGLYEDLTVLDNLKLYAGIYGQSVSKIRDLLRDVGLAHVENEKIKALSTGMLRRVSITRAMINNAELLLLDEPTSNLDPVSAQAVQQLISSINSLGTTVILCTHDMQEAATLCQEVIFLSNGLIIEQGSPEAIRYKHMSTQAVQVVTTLNEKFSYDLQKAADRTDLIGLIKNEKVKTIYSSIPTLGDVFLKLVANGRNKK